MKTTVYNRRRPPETERRHREGRASEHYVCYVLERMGIRAERAGEGRRWDVLTEKDGKLCRVQVKSVMRNGDEIKVSLRGNSDHDYYTSAEVDVIAVHERQDNEVYFVPIAEVDGASSVLLRINPPPKYVHPRTRLASSYTKFPA